MAQAVAVVGVPQAQADLRAKGKAAAHQRETMRQLARKTARRITGVPKDTGRLEASVRGGPGFELEVTETGYSIGTSVEYARFVFRGTSYVDARPPHVPSNLDKDAARAISSDIAHAR